MPSDRLYRWLPLIPGLAVGPAHTAQNDGVFENLAAAILLVLGLLAILLGVRNLRTLRQKHALPRERRHDPVTRFTRRPGVR